MDCISPFQVEERIDNGETVIDFPSNQDNSDCKSSIYLLFAINLNLLRLFCNL